MGLVVCFYSKCLADFDSEVSPTRLGLQIPWVKIILTFQLFYQFLSFHLVHLSFLLEYLQLIFSGTLLASLECCELVWKLETPCL